MRKVRVLLITSMPWRNDNNIGNSYSNLFGELENVEFAHIYCREGMPQNNICHRYFQVTEQSLVRNLKNRKLPTGKAFYLDNAMDTPMDTHSAAYDKLRIMRWQIFFIARDLIWKVGRWKTHELDEFVEDFKPDLIFGTFTYMPNINEMMVHIKEKFQLPLILYSWDDVYSLRHYSWSPFFWLRKFYQRHYMKKCASKCEMMYTISKEMKEEYFGYFKKECRMLYKGYDFIGEAPVKENVSNPVQMVFMGNIGAGRWKALAQLVKVLDTINWQRPTAFLNIYTLSPKTEEMLSALQVTGTSRVNDIVPNDQVMTVQRNADILVHVEPYDKADVSFYRLSFSTKLVDYFYNARCIIALGGKTASMSYLEDNDCGMVFYDLSELQSSLEKLFQSPERIIDYGKKSWLCGQTNHQRQSILNELKRNFDYYAKRS